MSGSSNGKSSRLGGRYGFESRSDRAFPCRGAEPQPSLEMAHGWHGKPTEGEQFVFLSVGLPCHPWAQKSEVRVAETQDSAPKLESRDFPCEGEF